MNEDTKQSGSGGLVTCVRLSKQTRDELAKMGNKSQTFDQIVNQLIEENKAGEIGK